MNYRHVYHAGNFADVIKHVILVQLMAAFERKDAPFCYIDTHAGAGYYNLFSDQAKKTKEYLGGIERIIAQPDPPAIVKRYLHFVHDINNDLLKAKFASLQYYPGSPMFARKMLRPHDRLVACELQVDEYQALRTTFAGDKQAAIHHTDGYLGLKAFLPPQERRGLILIDPPYENPDEFMHLAKTMPAALKRFETGTYAIWYPIKERSQINHFYKALKDTISKPILAIELTIYPDLPNHLNGCGLTIINPPWQFDEQIKQLLPWLWNALSTNKDGGYSAKML